MDNKELKSLARIYAFQFLYHLQLNHFSESREKLQEDINESNHDLINSLLNEFETALLESDEQKEVLTKLGQRKRFCKKLILGVIKESPSLEKDIEKCSTNWNIEKMNKVDLTLLLIAYFEIQHIDYTPDKVVINEAVNIAKQFGTNKSSSFINGVLNKLFELNNDKK